MAEAIDPNLIKAGMTDFSWISKGVTDGMDYAFKKQQLSQQADLAQARADELAQQKDTLTFQKINLLSGQIKELAETPPGPLKKAKQQTLLSTAQLMGIKLHPETVALFNDSAYTEDTVQFLANFKSASPDEQLQLYPKLVSLLGKEGADKEIKQANEDFKARQELGMKQEEVGLKKEEVGIKRGELQEKVRSNKAQESVDWFKAQTSRIEKLKADGASGAKMAKGLRSEAQKIEKIYTPVVGAPEAILGYLSQGTAAGDQAAKQRFVALIGDTRITEGELKSISAMGNYIEQIKAKYEQSFGSGKQLTDKNRLEMAKIVTEMASVRNKEMKASLATVYNEAIASAPDILRQGRIISPPYLKRLFNEQVSGAPSEKVAPKAQAAQSKSPVLILKDLSPAQAAALDRVRGKSRTALEKASGLKFGADIIKAYDLKE